MSQWTRENVIQRITEVETELDRLKIVLDTMDRRYRPALADKERIEKAAGAKFPKQTQTHPSTAKYSGAGISTKSALKYLALLQIGQTITPKQLEVLVGGCSRSSARNSLVYGAAHGYVNQVSRGNYLAVRQAKALVEHEKNRLVTNLAAQIREAAKANIQAPRHRRISEKNLSAVVNCVTEETASASQGTGITTNEVMRQMTGRAGSSQTMLALSIAAEHGLINKVDRGVWRGADLNGSGLH